MDSCRRGDLVGEFNEPYLCHTASDAVLVADWLNARMLLRHAGVFSPMLLQPQPRGPGDAVYAGGALYVLSRSYDGRKITKYVPKE